MKNRVYPVLRKGDRVRCLTDYCSGEQFTAGKVYVVRDDDTSGWVPVEADDKGEPNGWSWVYKDEPNFELVRDIPTSDPVSSPSHYVRGGYELIDVLEAWELSPAMYSAVCYIMRAKFKGSELTDLKKARWYLDREIGKLEAK